MKSPLLDLFERLVPLAVHNAISVYESKKSQLVNTEIGRMRDATQTMNG